MKATRLHLGGVSGRRLILLPEERRDDERAGRPRVRRYRLGSLSGQIAAPVSARDGRVATPSLARAQRA